MQAHPNDETLMNRYARMQERFEWLGGYEYESMSRTRPSPEGSQ